MSPDYVAAAKLVANGGVIAYPTEGVFGIGCHPLNEDALKRIVALKGRDVDKGMIVVCHDEKLLAPYVQNLPPLTALDPVAPSSSDDVTERSISVTWIVEAGNELPALLTGGRSTLAVRVSKHPVVVELTRTCKHPIVSTSANPSGQAPCMSAAEVHEVFKNELDLVIDAPLGGQRGPSRIIDARTGERLR